MLVLSRKERSEIESVGPQVSYTCRNLEDEKGFFSGTKRVKLSYLVYRHHMHALASVTG